ncbi:endo alpha-1,4 polygalactosaminidase [Kribbella sp. NBC_01505]|uniref:endo alpha-1,4 polygalactosaminidase n=1 Tax=Kribbella sp. NBC_01505 TaxID=2903580 RepID=UPI0038671A09
MVRNRLLLIGVVVVAVVAGGLIVMDRLPEASQSPAAGPTVTVPPLHSGLDYQLGGPYAPAAGVKVVVRDRSAPIAAGLYNVCYVNAFQTQPGEEGSWEQDLLLRDGAGKLVIDEDWDEPLLDLRTPDKRSRIAAKLNTWIDGCATSGYRAIEADNYDSYTRSKDLLTPDQAKALLTLLAQHAHSRNLAIGQKNTVELAGDRKAVGLDFAVAEECGQYDECAAYATAYDNNVLVIEYTDDGLRKACTAFGDRLSIVRRDRDVTSPGDPAYVRKTC